MPLGQSQGIPRSRRKGYPPGFDITYPETNSSHWGDTDVVSKVLDAVSELGSDAGLVVLDKKICTKVLVKRPILQHVSSEAATAMAAFLGPRRALMRKNLA